MPMKIRVAEASVREAKRPVLTAEQVKQYAEKAKSVLDFDCKVDVKPEGEDTYVVVFSADPKDRKSLHHDHIQPAIDEMRRLMPKGSVDFAPTIDNNLPDEATSILAHPATQDNLAWDARMAVEYAEDKAATAIRRKKGDLLTEDPRSILMEKLKMFCPTRRYQLSMDEVLELVPSRSVETAIKIVAAAQKRALAAKSSPSLKDGEVHKYRVAGMDWDTYEDPTIVWTEIEASSPEEAFAQAATKLGLSYDMVPVQNIKGTSLFDPDSEWPTFDNFAEYADELMSQEIDGDCVDWFEDLSAGEVLLDLGDAGTWEVREQQAHDDGYALKRI